MPGIAPSCAGLEGTCSANDLAVLELGGVLAHVPDIARRVLRVPVEGVLDEFWPFARAVSRTTRAVMPLASFLVVRGGDDDDVLGLALLVHVAVGPSGARLHRPVRVGDVGAEIGRVEVDRICAGGQR